MTKIVALILTLLFSSHLAWATATQWRSLAPGIEYTKIDKTVGLPTGAIHAFRINLKVYRLTLALTHNNKRPLITVKDLVKQYHGLLGINGGFFTPTLTPLGLRISQGQVLSPLKSISWWGVFYSKNHRAKIVTPKAFRLQKNIAFAIQAGPRLVINGHIPSLKKGLANRSALGITKNGRVIIAITNNLPLTTTAFAKILQAASSQGGLGCQNAINLDGGSSSQLYAQINNFHLNIPRFAPIADAILVVPRN